jgi:3-phosphoshikimate 1-carboxyvinyltransferase
MIVKVSASKTSGFLNAPASKSSMQRAVAAALLAEGTSTLLNPSFSEDSISAIKMAECLGAFFDISEEKIEVKGGFNPSCKTLNGGESGLGIRMFSAIASLSEKELEFNGTGSILNRPMDMLQQTLESLGVNVTTSNGKLPLKIKGPLKGGKAKVDGSVSSQFLTGLLFALPLAENDSVLEIANLKSKPYIDLTLDVLKKFGITIENKGYKKFIIPKKQKYLAAEYKVEGDWSGASFLAVLGAISGEIIIHKLQLGSSQADKNILNALKLAGASVVEENDTITISPNKLKAFNFDITDCPDLAPPLVALASFCEGRSVIKGTERLKVKESDRAFTLQKEFSTLGVDIQNFENRIEITGREIINGGVVSSHGDHRIAMALAVAATKSTSPVIIEGAEAINKSYPDFFNDLQKVGVVLETKKE